MNASVSRIDIVPSGELHAEGLRAAIDEVARERRYLASTRGFSLDETLGFLRNILLGNGVQFLALDGDEVIGWCDIVRAPYEGFAHVGSLGMGVRGMHRGRGIGRRLLTDSLRASADLGITRVELDVFASNTAAIRLYENFGFVVEGVKRQVRILDGRHDDIVCMALRRTLRRVQ